MRRRDRIWDGIASLLVNSLRLLPAEQAHRIGAAAIRNPLFRKLPTPQYGVDLSGMTAKVPGIASLAHPIGLAAGFDKNASLIRGCSHLGFSFLEVGTITPRPQLGNPSPRMFRYTDQHAIINRMGFNSEGSEIVYERLSKLARPTLTLPIGINLGKNKVTPLDTALEDYSSGIETFSKLADYFVINLSSPNTEGLRSLANHDFLYNLSRHHKTSLNKIWIKLDPDTDKKTFQKIIENICKLDYQGVILCNTHKVSWPESGGLSGHPLASLANSRLEWAYEVHDGSLPMISVGGIFSGLDVLERIKRGACAVQIYSALVYRGPWAVFKILRELQAEMQSQGISHLIDSQGTYFKRS